MNGLVFNIKRYSIHDGPGIRVTFFLKGCPLSCWWCHNPEGISSYPEKAEITEKVGGKAFIKVEEAGKYFTVDDVLNVLSKDRIFLTESKGGVTFSGGEPLLQPEFLHEALMACKSEGYHTAVDTSGYSQPENLSAIIPFTDLFLYDIKQLDDAKHIQFTSVSNTLILSNFKLILESGKDIMIRIPLIPGFNDDDKHLEMLKSFLTENKVKNLKKICILPYHKIGISKYNRFNIPYRMNGVEPPSADRMRALKEYFEETGIKTKTGG